MIRVFTGQQRADNSAVFERLFRLRREIFIEQRRWSIPEHLGGLEIDEYDVDDAVYLLDVDERGEILAGVRLTPTERCSLLADSFAHLVENGQPLRGPRLYEGMRFLTAPRLSRREAAEARWRILYAMVEWSIAHGVAWIQAMTDAEFFRTFVDMTIHTTPLGLAHAYAGGRDAPGGGECVAFRWPATQAVLDDLRQYGERERLSAPAYAH